MARVLVISNLFPPRSQGGYELACGDVVARWRAQGHDVEVLAGSDGTLPLTSVHAPTPPPIRRVGVERRARRALRAALRRRPDAVSVWNMTGLPSGLLSQLAEADVRVVYVLADAWPTRPVESDPWFALVSRLPGPVGTLVGLAARLPTRLPRLGPTGRWVFCSRSLRDRVVDALPQHAPFADTTIVPLGVDLTDFPLAAEADSRPWQGRLLYVGRLDQAKGIDTLLRAMAMLPEATLDVLGPPESHHLDRINHLVAELGLDDRIRIGSAPRAELATWYRRADAFVFPSEWEEPFGIVPLEAMACATPVVATGVGGSADFLRHEQNSLLVRPGHPDDLAAAISRLASEPELRRGLATNGLVTAAEYTSARLADALLPIHLPPDRR